MESGEEGYFYFCVPYVSLDGESVWCMPAVQQQNML